MGAHGQRVHHLLLEGVFGRGRLVHFDPQTGRVGWQPVAFLRAQRMLHHFPAPGHVGQHILLNQKVGRAQSKVECGGISHRSQRIVRRDTNIISLGHCRDLFGFPQSTAMTEIGLDDVSSLLLEDFAKLIARDQTFASGDRHGAGLAHLDHYVDIFGRHRLFNKIGAVGCQDATKLNRVGQRMAAMTIDHNIDIITDGRPNRGQRIFGIFVGSDAVERLGWRGDQDFDRVITQRDHF